MRLVLALCLAVTTAISAELYVAPLASARVNGRVYSTTTALRNDTATDISCDAAYNSPEPEGRIPAQHPHHQVGHVPDTAISGKAEPPAGWLDMAGVSNQCCGAGLATRIGKPVRVITVDGKLPQ